MSLYKVDAEKHRHLAEEFRKNPVGIHSPELQKVLNVFRGADMPEKCPIGKRTGRSSNPY